MSMNRLQVLARGRKLRQHSQVKAEAKAKKVARYTSRERLAYARARKAVLRKQRQQENPELTALRASKTLSFGYKWFLEFAGKEAAAKIKPFGVDLSRAFGRMHGSKIWERQRGLGVKARVTRYSAVAGVNLGNIFVVEAYQCSTKKHDMFVYYA